MLKIGEFSKLAQVSVKTLRYYDELGLLRPDWVDRYTGYRFYALQQLPRLNRILALRELGFSLAQAAHQTGHGMGGLGAGARAVLIGGAGAFQRAPVHVLR